MRQEAHLFNFYWMKRIAAGAALGALLVAGTLQSAMAQAAAGGAAPKKEYKPGEYELFDAAAKAVAANNFAKAITDLDAWKAKVPNSDYAPERSVLYIQAYNGAKQFDKAVDEGGQLLSKDIDAAFPDPAQGPGWVIRALVGICQAIPQIPNPTPEQTATGQKAATLLKNYNRKPGGVDDNAWNQAKTQLKGVADAALLYIAVAPANNALAKGDCDAAQTAFSKALTDYPDNSFISYQLGQAYMCTVKKDPSKSDEVRPKAIYEFIRTLVVDPSVAKTQDPKKMADILQGTYVNYHGGTDGLDQLKEQAKANPLPPAGFAIESATKVAERKQKEFESQNPKLAMWMKIKGALSAPDGTQYFETQLKNAAVPQLRGNVIEGKPACRSKELIVSVPEPNEKGAQPVITLKLDSPLTGKPEPGEILWEGVPSAFTAEPFMLTMDTEKAKIEGLKTTPCGPVARPRTGTKKGAAKKK